MTLSAAEAPPREKAEQTLRKATEYFTKTVAVEGGWLYTYSADLSKREGEHAKTATAVECQPPGTPSVGMALLDAWRATKDQYYMDAAKKAGMCLVRGQLQSGGWEHTIEFNPAVRAKIAYRVEKAEGAALKNVSTLDDNTTQACLLFLMELDKALEFKDAVIHEAAKFAADAVVAAQGANGAWPQRFTGPADLKATAPRKASYPETWSREFPKINYAGFYTLNDDAQSDTIEVMWQAGVIYGEAKYRKAAENGGGFLIMAQMPDPQPAWAQQYDFEMRPVWARKFEPPSVTGGESQGAMRTLMDLYEKTGDKKFFEPVGKALAYLKASKLPDGKLARFYELKTNKPLYFTKKYELTYSDADMPTHYSFKVPSRLESIEAEYERLKSADAKALGVTKTKRSGPPSGKTMKHAKEAIANIDAEGRWVEQGKLKNHEYSGPVISTHTFIVNVRALSQCIAAGK